MDCNSNKAGNDEDNKGSRQATATMTKRTMATATKVVGNKEGNCNSGKSDCNCKEGGG